MKRYICLMVSSLALLALLLSAVGHAWGAPAQKTATKSASMVNSSGSNPFAFSPKTLTVKVGTRVVWKNKTSAGHTVTAKGSHPAFDSGAQKLIQPGKTWSFVFKHAGTYHYYCVLHPYMTGTVVVTK